MAAQVIKFEEFVNNDPFIMLADDHLDIGDRTIGAAHPHAGFETVTLLLDGEIYDRDEGGTIHSGEVQWMTAGRGIIHGEHMMTKGKVRLLQLWLTLPKSRRWTTPGFQDIHADAVPVRHEPGADVRVYSGSSGTFRATTRNHVPVTIVEMNLKANATVDQELPLSYNGFLFVLRGSVRIGDDAQLLNTGQVGWFDRPNGEGTSVVHVGAGHEGARVVMYAGQPQGDPIVSHGPFIGDSRDDIIRLYAEYRAGRFEKMSELARAAATPSARTS
jgi:redox-sensitive bicupin YhaK (pirin superfamily)